MECIKYFLYRQQRVHFNGRLTNWLIPIFYDALPLMKINVIHLCNGRSKTSYDRTWPLADAGTTGNLGGKSDGDIFWIIASSLFSLLTTSAIVGLFNRSGSTHCNPISIHVFNWSWRPQTSSEVYIGIPCWNLLFQFLWTWEIQTWKGRNIYIVWMQKAD